MTLHRSYVRPLSLYITIAIQTTFSFIASADELQDSPIYAPGALDAIHSVIRARSGLSNWRYRGKHSRSTKGSDSTLRSEIYGAFDAATNCYRFESVGETALRLASGNASAAEKTVEEQAEWDAQHREHALRYLAVQNRDYMIEWYGIGTPFGASGDSAANHIQLQDVNTPLSFPESLIINPCIAAVIDAPVELNASLVSKFERFAKKAESVTLTSEGDEILQLTYLYPDRAKRTVTINAKNGFTVTRSSAFRIDESGVEAPLPRIESTAAWQLINDTWVPEMTDWTYVDQRGAVQQIRYEFSWLAVNAAEVGEDVFDYETYTGFWDGLAVIDDRDGVSRVLTPPGLRASESDLKLTQQQIDRSQEAKPTRRAYWLILNLIAILILGSMFVARRIYVQRNKTK